MTNQPPRHHKSMRQRRVRAVVVLAAAVGIVGAAWFAWHQVSELLSGPEDYVGVGTGSVTVEVEKGANGLDIAKMLASSGVVKSVDAYYQEALNDPRSAKVQPGFYQLKRKMSANAALTALADPANRVEGKVVIPEGARVGEIVEAIVKGSDLTEDEVTQALENPRELNLPEAANGNPEGYLFPATYTVQPDMTATELLKQMRQKSQLVADKLDIKRRAAELGFTKHEILTIASLLEKEANRKGDYAKVARVIYNRLEKGMALELDSTVSFLSEREGDVWTTPKERANPSQYNTYKHPGLPPGPIGSPGEVTINAALNPADGDWLFFVTDFASGKAVFADSLKEHNANAERAKEYCRSSDEC